MQCPYCGGGLQPVDDLAIGDLAGGIGFYETCIRVLSQAKPLVWCATCRRLLFPALQQRLRNPGKRLSGGEQSG